MYSLTTTAPLTGSDILQCIREQLTLSGQLDPVINLARQLPLFSGSILELHNDRGDQWFDYSMRVNNEYDKPLVDNEMICVKIPEPIREGYRQLINENDTFRFGIQNIWFEYDAPFNLSPSMFFDIHRNRRLSPAEKFADIKRVADIFKFPCSQELEPFLLCLERYNLNVEYFGMMFPRNTQSLRLTISGITVDNLVETIHHIGWHGNTALVKYIKKMYLYSDNKLLLDLDFDMQVGPKIGIEVLHNAQDGLLTKFRDARIYAHDQYDFLKKWSAIKSLPSPIAASLSETFQRPVDLVYRRISHFKFSLDGEAVKTKAYLYYCF